MFLVFKKTICRNVDSIHESWFSQGAFFLDVKVVIFSVLSDENLNEAVIFTVHGGAYSIFQSAQWGLIQIYGACLWKRQSFNFGLSGLYFRARCHNDFKRRNLDSKSSKGVIAWTQCLIRWGFISINFLWFLLGMFYEEFFIRIRTEIPRTFCCRASIKWKRRSFYEANSSKYVSKLSSGSRLSCKSRLDCTHIWILRLYWLK